MSVLSYLQKRSSEAVLTTTELNSISTSITTLQARLTSYFGVTVSGQFQFGSSTRGTILPRKMDAHSDIDYMVLFAETGYTPQTYLDRIRRFSEKYYFSSIIKQSFPTIVLELNHIKFDLVPAVKSLWSGYNIAGPNNSWLSTNPNDFNGKLTTKNNECRSLIKPTIRLAKLWNAANGYVYESYQLEKWIVEQWYWNCSNQTEYLFKVFDLLDTWTVSTKWQKERIERAKQIVSQVRVYERNNMLVQAEIEVKKLIPA